MNGKKKSYNLIDGHLVRLAEFKNDLEMLNFEKFSHRFIAIERETQELIAHLKRALYHAGNMLDISDKQSSNALEEGFFHSLAKAGHLMGMGQCTYANSHILKQLYSLIPEQYAATRLINPRYYSSVEASAAELKHFLTHRMRPPKDYYAAVAAAYGNGSEQRFCSVFGKLEMEVLWVRKEPFLRGINGACCIDHGIFAIRDDGTALTFDKNGEFIGPLEISVKTPIGCYQGEDGCILLTDSSTSSIIILDGQGGTQATLFLKSWWNNPQKVYLTSSCMRDGIVYAALYDWLTYYSFVIELSPLKEPRLVFEKQGAKFVVSAGPNGIRILDIISREIIDLNSGRPYFKLDLSMFKSDANGLFLTNELMLVPSAREVLVCDPDGLIYYCVDFIHLFGDFILANFMFPVCSKENLFGLYSSASNQLALLRIPAWNR